MKSEFIYGTLDPRFGKEEILTIKQMILRYRTQNWDINEDGSRMSVDNIMDNIIDNGAFCLS